ncbi:MAG: leucine-rich repeat protein [Clostridia bacterium]|nr:leucine-rich repeat protein [Clostridia bacterium]
MSNGLFEINESGVLKKYNGNEKTVYIPDGVSGIACGAFADSPDVEKIVVPASVKTVNYQAFRGCSSLKTIRFLGTEKIDIKTKAFDELPSPLEIIYSGTLEAWINSSKKYDEEQHEYNGGWGGGAPGVYTYVYTYYPMEHTLGEAFTYTVKTLADGKTFTGTGKREDIGSLLVSSPYDV